MKKILIIKLGAIGDVIRTTPLLHVLKGDITWVTLEESIPLLRGILSIKEVIPLQDFRKILKKKFDWVINLEEEWKAIALYELVHARKKTRWIKEWCRLSIDDERKKTNIKPYQYFMFRTIGKQFKGEEYVLNIKPKDISENIIGIEQRAGDRWKLKRWNKFEKFISHLEQMKLKYKIFNYRRDILDFVRDINECKVIITGDTLAMHIGLGLRKKVIALFGPTSSQEIYSYGRLIKIISPIDCQCCYKPVCTKSPNCMDMIEVDIVMDVLKKIVG